MTRLIVLVLTALPLVAQNALYLEIGAGWRISAGDDPAYAQPDFDDQDWELVDLPARSLFGKSDYWLRRTVTLPEGSDRTRLALTLGALGECQLWVNGTKIAETRGFQSEAEAPLPQPRTFDIPSSALANGESLHLAVRVRFPSTGHHPSSPRDRGPYVLTDREHAPTQAAVAQFSERFVQWSPQLVNGSLMLGVAALCLWAWWGDRKNRALFWFFWFCLAFSANNLYLMHQLDPAARHRIAGVSLQFQIGVARFLLIGEFALAALGTPGRWWWRGALWLAFAVTQWKAAPGSLLSFTWLIVIALADWWRWRGRSAPRLQGAFRCAILAYGLSGAQNFAAVVLSLDTLRLQGFTVGRYVVNTTDLASLGLVLAMLAALMLRLRDDRRAQMRLAGELEAARTVQQLLLPPADRSAADAVYTVDAVYEPAAEVGGDFHWRRAGAGGSLLVVVGDVSGKGLKAAMLVSVVIGVLRTVKESSPAAVLVALNDGLTGHTGGGFVTCCCARFDASGAVTFANAGHPSPYCDGREVALDAGLPLGVIAGAAYEESVLQGERFTFVSDGVVEAENSRRELFGFDRTREISTKSAREIADAAKAWGQNDDITVVTVRRAA